MAQETDSDIQRVWLCEGCGEACTGDMCMKCGRDRSPSTPYAPDPSSYLGIIGAPRTVMAGKWLLLVILSVLAVQFFVGQVFRDSKGPVLTAPQKQGPSELPR